MVVAVGDVLLVFGFFFRVSVWRGAGTAVWRGGGQGTGGQRLVLLGRGRGGIW